MPAPSTGCTFHRFSWIFSVVLLYASAGARADDHQLHEQVEAAIMSDQSPVSLVRFSAEDLRAFYRAREYQPLWLGDGQFEARLQALLNTLRSANSDGLRADAYMVDELASAVAKDRLLNVEFHATRALLRYAFDLREGRVTPQQGDLAIHVAGEVLAPFELLQLFAAAEDPARFLAKLAPANPHYVRLRKALAEHRRTADATEWERVPDGPVLRQGDVGLRVQALHARLTASGDMTAVQGDTTIFDKDLYQAVVRFQRRHGLDADGVVGAKTLAALNVPIEERIEQIIVNMERWRWFPNDLGVRHVLVNMAGFELDVVEGGRVIMDMPVVVGRPYRQTPSFSDRIRYLEFNPTWTVPPGIMRNDILPKLREDPGYLAANEMRVFPGWTDNAQPIDPHNVDWKTVDARRIPYRIVQSPGPKNALGRVKFMFPNRFNVYLHDTPSPELFAKTQRVFSSGCIRIEKPLELATYLLIGDARWSRQHIDTVVQQGRRTTVSLPTPVAVHLIYATTWIDQGGTVHFRPDVYDRDARLRNALHNAHLQSALIDAP